jgi:adenosylcobyric acid synthase
VKGVIINKFRGDIALLYSGIEQIEALTGVPVLGVLPWLEVDLEDEDSVALQKGKYLSTAKREIDIAVVQLPIPQTSPISTRWRRSRMSACAT